MPNISRAEFDKMMTDESFQAFKRQDFKAEYMYIIKYYRIKLDGEKTYTDKRVISKILKLDGNNQYGYATTKTPNYWLYEETGKSSNRDRM